MVMMCSTILVGAQEPTMNYGNVNNEDTITIELSEEGVGIPVYASSEANGVETKAKVQVGTVYWYITRLQPNGTKCALDLQYVATSPVYAASSVRYGTLRIGSGLNFSQYGSFSNGIHFFRYPMTNGFITDIEYLTIPTSVSRVTVRTTGLQAYVNGDCTAAQLGAQSVSIG